MVAGQRAVVKVGVLGPVLTVLAVPVAKLASVTRVDVDRDGLAHPDSPRLIYSQREYDYHVLPKGGSCQERSPQPRTACWD